MSQNKFMHPRNIYRKPPSFKEMAIMYPEFRKYAKPDLSGKISIDFKDPGALKALTCTLLEKDFGLKVDIPLTRLIPTLPLRLNYLLWIEDLLQVGGISKSNYASVSGIDIGTGASCIYPLLAAKQNEWHMIGTDVDNESFEIAQKNVNNNNLQHLITVKLVEGDQLLKEVADSEESHTFSMCNPPFFSSEQELDFANKSRSPSRPPPHNGTTGDIRELVAPGGETAFILKMMGESKGLSTKVRIYTTMVGHKSSLGVLKLELQKLQVASMTETRFCQGNTTRWGIAWTFEKNLSLQKAYQTPNQKKCNTPMSYVVPSDAVEDESMYSVEVITKRVAALLTELKVQYQIKKQNKHMSIIDILAFKNTWSNQRQKKRMQYQEQKKELVYSHQTEQLEEKQEMKTEKQFSGKDNISQKRSHISSRDGQICKKRKVEETTRMVSCSCLDVDAGNSTSPVKRDQEVICSSTEGTSVMQQKGKAPSVDKISVQNTCLLEATFFIRNIASEVHIELLWKGGTGGRDSMHQILQHFKNKLK